MEMTQLTEQCLALPKVQKAKLVRMLIDSLKDKREEDVGKRFSLLYNAATDVCGKGILTKLRNRGLVIGRSMIAYKMRKEGYSLMTIGKHLHMHHTSVLHHERRMEDAFTFQFADEILLWKEFLKKVEEYEKKICC